MGQRPKMRLVGEVPCVAASVAGNSDGRERRAGSIFDDLAGGVLVQVPGKEDVLGGVDLGALDTCGDGSAVVTTCDLDVEGLIQSAFYREYQGVWKPT